MLLRKRPTSLGLSGDDDEALRCGTDVMEGKTRDERQRMTARRLNHGYIGRLYDRRRFHHVRELVFWCLQRDPIAWENVLQRPEQRVAVSRQHDVSFIAWQRSAGKMPDGTLKNRLGFPLDHDRCETEPPDAD